MSYYCFGKHRLIVKDRNDNSSRSNLYRDAGCAASACTFTLSPTNNTYYSAEGGSGNYTGTFSVTASGSGCSWSAISDSNWITITSGNSGTGSGTGTYTVSPNNAISGRTGTISVGDQSFTVTQDGQPSHVPTQFRRQAIPSSARRLRHLQRDDLRQQLFMVCNFQCRLDYDHFWKLRNRERHGELHRFDHTTTSYPMTGTITVENQTFTVTLAGNSN